MCANTVVEALIAIRFLCMLIALRYSHDIQSRYLTVLFKTE